MANRNSAGFGLIPVGNYGSTPATGGQGKFYIVAAYATAMYQGTSVRVVNGYIQTAQAAITKSTVGVLNVCSTMRYNFEANLAELLYSSYSSKIAKI